MLNLNFFSTLLIPFKVNQELSKFENVSFISIVMHGVWLELQIRQNKEKKKIIGRVIIIKVKNLQD